MKVRLQSILLLPGISLEESDKMGRIAENILLSIPKYKLWGEKTGRLQSWMNMLLGVNVSEIEAPFVL